MDSIVLSSFTPFKLISLSLVSYFAFVYLLRPILNFIRVAIHYHGFHHHPKSLLFGHSKIVWPNFPFHIDIDRILTNFYELYNRLDSSYFVSIFWISIYPIVVTSSPQAVEAITKKSLRKPHYYKFLGLGSGLITSDPEVWKVRRKLAEPFFLTKKLKVYAKCMYEEIELFSERLNEQVGKPVDLTGHIHLSALNIILKTAMSIPLDDSIEDKKRFIKIMHKLEKNGMTRLSHPFYHLDWMFKFFKFSKVYYQTIEDSEQIVDRMLSRREQLLKLSNGPKDQDFVDLLGDNVDRQGLTDELITAFAAGYDTTAMSLLWLLFTLGHHSDVQEKLYQEIIEIFPDDAPIDDLDKINQCSYLDQCLKESLRLNPTVGNFARVLDEDIMVKEKRLLKGSITALSINTNHHDQHVYPDPEKYDPDRWTPENASKIPKASFIPFGYGPRMCIGYRYAMIELKIYAAQIIRKFSFISTRKRESIPILNAITSHPALPLEIIMTPRNNNQ